MSKIFIQIIEDKSGKVLTFSISKIFYRLIILLFILIVLFSFGLIYIYSDYIGLGLYNNKLKNEISKIAKKNRDFKNLKIEVIKLKKLEDNLDKIINTNEIKRVDIKSILEEKIDSNDLIIEDKIVKKNIKYIPNILPCAGWITAEFVPNRHLGIDIATKKGTPIISSADGEIYYIGKSVVLGNYIIIKHGDVFLTKYAHCDRIIVKEHQKVKKGALIAFVGKTGEAKGFHLHYEILYKGNNIDPLKFLEKYKYLIKEE